MTVLDTNAPNPWRSIWTEPRATIQRIVDSNPEAWVLSLAAIGGFSQVLDRASQRNAGDKLDVLTIFLIAAAAGPVGGIVSLYVGGALIGWTGKWLGGRAPRQNIRAAIGWSNVPLVWSLALWVPELALFGKELFTSATPRLDESLPLTFTLVAFAVVEVAIAIWAIVVFLKCVGQVQGFSAWKALANVLLAVAVVVVPVVAMVLLLSPGNALSQVF